MKTESNESREEAWKTVIHSELESYGDQWQQYSQPILKKIYDYSLGDDTRNHAIKGWLGFAAQFEQNLQQKQQQRIIRHVIDSENKSCHRLLKQKTNLFSIRKDDTEVEQLKDSNYFDGGFTKFVHADLRNKDHFFNDLCLLFTMIFKQKYGKQGDFLQFRFVDSSEETKNVKEMATDIKRFAQVLSLFLQQYYRDINQMIKNFSQHSETTNGDTCYNPSYVTTIEQSQDLSSFDQVDYEMIAYKQFFDLHPEIEKIGQSFIGGMHYQNHKKFTKVVTELKNCRPEDLKLLKPEFYLSKQEEPYMKPMMRLKQLLSSQNPIDQLMTIKKIRDDIYNEIDQYFTINQSQITNKNGIEQLIQINAQVLLSIFVYITIKANEPELLNSLNSIQVFLDDKLSEYGIENYCFNQLMNAFNSVIHFDDDQDNYNQILKNITSQ